MEGSVKREQAPARRRYDNSRRRARTDDTRARVVAAARTLFLAQGYVPTTVEAAAEAAGVAPATVYRLFGSKRDLLKAIIDVSAGGDDQPIPFHRRPHVVAMLDEPDPARLLERFARLVAETSARLDPLYAVVEAAAAVDGDCAELATLMREQRFVGHGRVARALAARRALAKGLTVAQAHDVVYAVSSPELRRVLVQQRGWTRPAYERWLARTLAAAVLPRP